MLFKTTSFAASYCLTSYEPIFY